MSKTKEQLLAGVTLPEPGQELTLLQKAKQLQMHPETLARYAATLGGRKIGGRWRFPWDERPFTSQSRQAVTEPVPHRTSVPLKSPGQISDEYKRALGLPPYDTGRRKRPSGRPPK